MLNLEKPPRIDHPYFFDRVASNPWQDLRGRARFPQGLLGGQIVGRNECLQIPERLLQDVLGAYQLLLMVKDIMLQRGHGSAGLALDRTSGTPSPTARLRAYPTYGSSYLAGNFNYEFIGTKRGPLNLIQEVPSS